MKSPLTPRQRALLRVLYQGNAPEYRLTLDEVIERAPYAVSKAAIQFTVRSLIRRGLIIREELELIGSRKRRILRLTPEGVSIAQGRLHPASD